MAISLVAAFGKVNAAIANNIINMVNRQGLTSMIPTSASGGTVGAAGKVSFSAATAVSVNGCFTSDFDNYLIVFDFTTSSTGTLGVTLRTAGTDAITAYDSNRFQVQAATAAGSQTLNAVNWVASGGIGITGATQSGELMVFGPFLTAATRARVENNITPNPMTASAGMYEGTLLHRTAASYDGFTFTPSTGTFTGNVRVYGINNN